MARVSMAKDGAIAVLTLDHPEKRNALSDALISELLSALDLVRTDSTRVVVVRARPEVTVWSSGHDIDELPSSRRDPLGWSEPLRALVQRLQNFPAPVMALLEGGVWGGACEVVFACDLIVATPNVTFAITPARLGVPYGLFGLQTLAGAMPRALLKELIYTAQPIPVQRAWALGLVNHVVPADSITDFTLDLARIIAANAPLTIAATKEQLGLLDQSGGWASADLERLQELRRSIGESEDYREGLAAFSEKRRPIFRGQ